MNAPQVKIIAVSNVYCRVMNFVNKGDIEIGHYHTYDHGTLVSSGSLLVEMLEDDDTVISSKVFNAPSLIFVVKDKKHKLIALQDGTVAACIHAMRDIEGNLLSPDFLIDEKWFADKWEDSNNASDHYHIYTERERGVVTDRFSLFEKPQEKEAA